MGSTCIEGSNPSYSANLCKTPELFRGFALPAAVFRFMSAIRLFFSFFFIVLLAACGPSAERQAVVLQGKTMGTTYTVKYLSDGLKDLPPPE